MKPLKYYIAQGIVTKILEDIKKDTFKINTTILLHELLNYKNNDSIRTRRHSRNRT